MRFVVLGIVSLFACATFGCRAPSAEESFWKTHGRGLDCSLGGRYADCAEVARLENNPVKRAQWLERGCMHEHGDLCVERVGTSDYPARDVETPQAIALLAKGCSGKHPGRSCAELVYRRLSLIPTFLGENGGLDARNVADAERACFLGGGSLPMRGLGPSPCYFVARAYLEGLAGRPVDVSRAALLLEQGCMQELDLAREGERSGSGCIFAARVYMNQPLVGALLADRKPIDEVKAHLLLERACADSQTDACTEL